MSRGADEELDTRLRAALGETPPASAALRARLLASLDAAASPGSDAGRGARVRAPRARLHRLLGVALAAGLAALAWSHLRPHRHLGLHPAPARVGELVWVDEDDDVESAFAELGNEADDS